MSKKLFSGRGVICLTLMVIAVSVLLTAKDWPFKTALFPVGIAIVILILTTWGLTMVLTGKDAHEGSARDFSLTELEGESTTWPTLMAFAWILAFFVLIIFVGFKISVPLYVFLCCYYQGKEKLWVSLVMAGFSWVFFWFLFIWLLNTPMNDGLIFTWLGIA
jgi:hypothetical protein